MTRSRFGFVEIWSGSRRPSWSAELGWMQGSMNRALVCPDELLKLGVRVPTDRPILVEFSARVVREGA